MNMARLSLLVLGMVFLLGGCVSTGGQGGSAAKARADADTKMYQPIDYPNQGIQGPALIVLPGKIKSNNTSFLKQVTTNNIADFGELELSKANFRVLERRDLGPMLKEIDLAVQMGNTQTLNELKSGKFKCTKWFVKFDVLKAEQVSKVKSGFSGQALGSIFGTLVGGTAGSVGSTAGGSVSTADNAGVWIIGMRYKLIDSSTSEQVATGYFEDKMEVGKKGISILGVSQSQEGGVTLDSMVQRLVQSCVADMDQRQK